MAKPTPVKPHPWFEAAMAFGKAKQGFCEVIFGSPEYIAWRAYFIGLNWIPATFRQMSNGSSWTAPIRWPHELEIVMPVEYPRSSYEAVREVSEPKPQKVFNDRECRENLEAMRKRFGPTWGLGRRLPRNEQMLADFKLRKYQEMVGVPAQEAAE